MTAPIRRIGVLTSGGDAPGLNAVIRAVVKAGVNAGIEVVGLEDSFDGLIEPNRSRTSSHDARGLSSISIRPMAERMPVTPRPVSAVRRLRLRI